jgi:hypothetical protein
LAACDLKIHHEAGQVQRISSRVLKETSFSRFICFVHTQRQPPIPSITQEPQNLQSRSQSTLPANSTALSRLLKPNPVKLLRPLSTANHTQCLPHPPSLSPLRTKEHLLSPPLNPSRPSQWAPSARSTTFRRCVTRMGVGMTAYDPPRSHIKASAEWSTSQIRSPIQTSLEPRRTGPATFIISDSHPKL